MANTFQIRDDWGQTYTVVADTEEEAKRRISARPEVFRDIVLGQPVATGTEAGAVITPRNLSVVSADAGGPAPGLTEMGGVSGVVGTGTPEERARAELNLRLLQAEDPSIISEDLYGQTAGGLAPTQRTVVVDPTELATIPTGGQLAGTAATGFLRGGPIQPLETELSAEGFRNFLDSLSQQEQAPLPATNLQFRLLGGGTPLGIPDLSIPGNWGNIFGGTAPGFQTLTPDGRPGISEVAQKILAERVLDPYRYQDAERDLRFRALTGEPTTIDPELVTTDAGGPVGFRPLVSSRQPVTAGTTVPMSLVERTVGLPPMTPTVVPEGTGRYGVPRGYGVGAVDPDTYGEERPVQRTSPVPVSYTGGYRDIWDPEMEIAPSPTGPVLSAEEKQRLKEKAMNDELVAKALEDNANAWQTKSDADPNDKEAAAAVDASKKVAADSKKTAEDSKKAADAADAEEIPDWWEGGTTGAGTPRGDVPAQTPPPILTTREIMGISPTAGMRRAWADVYGQDVTGRGPIAGYLRGLQRPLQGAMRGAALRNFIEQQAAGVTGAASPFALDAPTTLDAAVGAAPVLGAPVATQLAGDQVAGQIAGQPTASGFDLGPGYSFQRFIQGGVPSAFEQALQNVQYLRGVAPEARPAGRAGLFFDPQQAADVRGAAGLLGAAQRARYSPLVSGFFQPQSEEELYADYVLGTQGRAREGLGAQNFLDFAASRYGL